MRGHTASWRARTSSPHCRASVRNRCSRTPGTRPTGGLAIDPDLPEALTALAEFEAHYNWDLARAEDHLRHAMRVSPSFADAHARHAGHLVAVGRSGKRSMITDKRRRSIRCLRCTDRPSRSDTTVRGSRTR